MSVQHVDAMIANLYNYDQPNWTTPRSAYAHARLRWLRGETRTEPPFPQHPPFERASWEQLRARIDREFER